MNDRMYTGSMIAAQIGVLSYIIISEFQSNNTSIAALLIVVLLFICASMFSRIMTGKVARIVLLSIAAAICLYGYYAVAPVFVLLLPVCLCEGVHMHVTEQTLSGRRWIVHLVVQAVPALMVADSVKVVYLLSAVLTFVIFYTSVQAAERMCEMNQTMDKLRESNANLMNRIERDSQYGLQVKYVSQLEERNKIAQQLHDGIGHTIAGSLMQLEAAKLIVHEQPEQAQQLVGRVICVLREGMEDIRTTLHSLKPMKEQLGINRVKLIVDEFSVSSQMRVNFTFEGNLDLVPVNYWRIIADNVQEGLTNSGKYSKATAIRVFVQVLNRFVRLEVSDNGRGADNIRKGLGMRGMEERAESVGGKIIADGSKGFSVITLLPLEGEKYVN